MRKTLASLIVVVVFLCCTGSSYAVILPFQIFTNDGQYNDNPGALFYVDVTDGEGTAAFTFYNQSTFDCSIARIYFDDGSLLGVDEIIDGPGTNFEKAFPGPGNLPNGGLLTPPFVADREFNIGAVNPPPENGVNSIPAGEWVKIRFDLVGGGNLQGVINELYSGELRVGLHIISFPDGSSESAILTPEPATICLLGLGVLGLLRKRKGYGRNS